MSNTHVLQRKRSSSGSLIQAKRLSHKSKSKTSIRSKSKSSIISKNQLLEEDDVKRKINYRKELTFLFFSSMLDSIIEDCTVVVTPSESEAPTNEFVDCTTSTCMFLTERPSTSKTASRSSKSSRRTSGDLKPRTSQSSRSLITESTSKRNSNDWIAETEDQNVKMKFTNGNYYEGQVSKRLMHGKGVFYWADGTIYEGDFQDGYPTGKGTLKLPDLSSYEGSFCKGIFHGYGILNIVGSPVFYKGNWKYGQKHGKGWLLYENDNFYDGEWVDNLRQGLGYRSYKNGAKYKGYWLENLKHGQGSMIFENNDFYEGEWCNDLMHGYGEYTWNAFLNKTLTYPLSNWYRGTWVEGMRTGVGEICFGSECGARLLGTFEKNFKHGPGLMVCGNGLVLEDNPLFEYDKPTHKKLEDVSYPTITKSSSSLELTGNKSSFKLIIEQLLHKESIENFPDDIIENLERNGEKLNKNHFIKVAQSSKDKFRCSPLQIPIHAAAERVDVGFYLDMVLEKYYGINVAELNVLEEITDSKLTYLQAKQKEERKLCNLFTFLLPQLNEVYYKYATLAAEDGVINFKPVMMRILLWQFYRDIGLATKGISIVQSDRNFEENPASCVDTAHDPFEPIYFWQFLLSMVGNCLHLFHVNGNKKTLPSEGILFHMFNQFFKDLVLPNWGKFTGTVLTRNKNFLPLNSVYSLYLDVGESHSAKEFLRNTCVKRGSEPECFWALDLKESTSSKTSEGFNAVAIAQSVTFLKNPENYNENTLIQENSRHCDDPFFKTLYVFRKLGVNEVVQCISEICPMVAANGLIINMEYPLSFLEFYEILLLCANKLAEVELKAEGIIKPPVIDLPEVLMIKNSFSKSEVKSSREKKIKVKK